MVGGKTSKIETMPAVEDDPQRRKPDIARAKKFLHWEPRVPLKTGLDKTIEYFRKELERSNHSNRNIYVPDENEMQTERKHLPNDSVDKGDAPVVNDKQAETNKNLHK